MNLFRSIVTLCITSLLTVLPASAYDQMLELIAMESVESQDTTQPIKDKWALIIGLSKFANPAINLKYPSKDAKDFANFLVSKQGFAPDHVKVLVDQDATRANILTAIGGKWLPRRALPDDLVVIFISTHGSQPDVDVEGVNYIVAHDTDVNNLYATGIAMQDLGRLIKGKVHTNRIVMLIDACHSGTVSPEGKGLVRAGSVNVDHMMQGAGQVVISSSEPNQLSWESKNYDNSVFTRKLMDALSSEGTQTPLDKAFQMMKSKVQEEVARDRGCLQTPNMKSRWKGPAPVLGTKATEPRQVPETPDELAMTSSAGADKASTTITSTSTNNGATGPGTTTTNTASINVASKRMIEIFGNESAYLGSLGGYSDMGANSPNRADHVNWASTRSPQMVTNNLVNKFLLQYSRQSAISADAANRFYGEASAHLASYGIDLHDAGSNLKSAQPHTEWAQRNSQDTVRQALEEKVRFLMDGAK